LIGGDLENLSSAGVSGALVERAAGTDRSEEKFSFYAGKKFIN